MARIVAPTLRVGRGSRAPRSNPCGCQHAPARVRHNPDERNLALKIGRHVISFNDPHNPRGVLLEQVFSAMLNSLSQSYSTNLEDAIYLEEVSLLAQFYLDAWVTIEETTPLQRLNMLKKESQHEIDPGPIYEEDAGLDIRPFQHACAETLNFRGGTIPAESASSLVFMDAVISGLPWEPETQDRMRTTLRTLWKQEPFFVADMTGIHCAYSFGTQFAEDHGRQITTADFSSIKGAKTRINEELVADTREYLKRNPTRLEREQAWRSYEIHQDAAVPFVNNRNNPVFFSKIQPFA